LEKGLGEMTRYVILGHGGFDPTSSSYPPEVLIPPDTTVQFFSDAGQALVLPYKGGDADYSKVAPMWNQLKDQGSPVEPKGVTYNFTLYPGESAEEVEGARRANWGGAVEIEFVSSGTTYLCKGAPETCPTPKLNVAAGRHDELVAKGDAAVKAFKEWLASATLGEFPTEIADFASRLTDVPEEYYEFVADGVPDGRWKHHCDGILGTRGGGGNELSWIACTSFEFATPELPSLVTADASGPGTTDVSTWVPDDAAYKTVREQNAKALKATPDDGSVAIVAGGAILLVGAEHERRPGDYVRRQTDVEEGQLTVKKGGAFSKGSIEVKGISAKQALVKSEIGEFSDKKITFV
jgi:hypothetical protein